ncbi:MAG: ATP-binding cassette domain-containing protein [Candidatus Dormiibacterota bacterium]
MLDSLGIEHLARIAFQNLSGGQKQRVSIALALVGNPKIAHRRDLLARLGCCRLGSDAARRHGRFCFRCLVRRPRCRFSSRWFATRSALRSSPFGTSAGSRVSPHQQPRPELAHDARPPWCGLRR